MSMPEILSEMTGSPVESVTVSEVSRSTTSQTLDDVELWNLLQICCSQGSLMVCTSRLPLVASFSETLHPSVHAILDVAEEGDPSVAAAGIGHSRAIRLRNPRVGGLNCDGAALYHGILAALHGIPAEGSTYADGSFWVKYPADFKSAFGQLDICHSAASGGSLANTRSFEGEFTPEKGSGIRGCAFRFFVAPEQALETDQKVDLWITLFQPTPQGSRLMKPTMGHVLNDLAILVLDAATMEPCTVNLGGACPSVTVRMQIQCNQEFLVLPFSYRAQPGVSRLRFQASAPISVQPAISSSGGGGAAATAALDEQFTQMARLTWKNVLEVVSSETVGVYDDSAKAFPVVQRGLRSRGNCRVYPLRIEKGVKASGVDLLMLDFEGACLCVVRNPSADHGILVKFFLEGNLVATQTSRGAQFGEWCSDRNEGSADVKRMWRQYAVEDVIPAASHQLVCVLLAVDRGNWAVELKAVEPVKLVPRSSVGARPPNHPFAPHNLVKTAWHEQSSSNGNSNKHVNSTNATVTGTHRHYDSNKNSMNDSNFANLGVKYNDDDITPHLLREGFYEVEDGEDEALKLALEISFQESLNQSIDVCAATSENGAAPTAAEAAEVRGGEAAAVSGHRWARRRNRATVSSSTSEVCEICTDHCPGQMVSLRCCSGQVCRSCAERWAAEQESQGFAVDELLCPSCAQPVELRFAEELLSPKAFKRAQQRSMDRKQLNGFAGGNGVKTEKAATTADHGLSSAVLSRLGLKCCPNCGEGTQKESDSCHKMICRNCRARFCFRCLTRLEYFNCGCTGAEHRFVDPVNGKILDHQ
eukprot:TRINITY_DN25905_c0_g1_i1.p1 TRINITY_DN25905_c0_g1~~TRINITY_DN25905_c0_g1_i1.p1  ORF type:complete len:910 (+),score=150.15 TRINITY_DN25905_c0_g1_i1:288-2732(+)